MSTVREFLDVFKELLGLMIRREMRSVSMLVHYAGKTYEVHVERSEGKPVT